MAVRQITFLSDFGHGDVFVGLCHAVIAAIAPTARVADLTHEIPPHDVVAGAVALADCVPYVPAAVHMAVVDPGVGSQREGVVIVAGDALLVGPDNGLLVPAARRLGGPSAAYRLSAPRFRRPQVSPTFHGRDIFAPAAAHLALGVAPDAFGTALDVDRLADPGLPVTRVADRVITAAVRGIDRFGNVQVAVTAADLARAGLEKRRSLRLVTAGGAFELRRATTFSDLEPGALGLIEDSMGWLAVVMDRDTAARRVRLATHDPVRLEGEGEPQRAGRRPHM
jgi:S-adenosyl-L-methionine hydrolase (adenosine-forming)